MLTFLYVLLAILVFGVLIMIHELGHFLVARACGVGIREFSIGMGPKLLQRKTKNLFQIFCCYFFDILFIHFLYSLKAAFTYIDTTKLKRLEKNNIFIIFNIQKRNS